VGMSAWLPFRKQIMDVIRDSNGLEGKRDATVKFVREFLGLDEVEGGGELKTPMLLCHGEDDQKVKLEWGCEMRDLMCELGVDLSFKSYSGLEHWYNEDEMRDIILFLRGIWGHAQKEVALGDGEKEMKI
jgi:Phospholipase/Carboxylesterase